MKTHEHAAPRRQKTDRGGWRFESEQLENESFFLTRERLSDPSYHDGWSAIRRRPRSASGPEPRRE